MTAELHWAPSFFAEPHRARNELAEVRKDPLSSTKFLQSPQTFAELNRVPVSSAELLQAPPIFEKLYWNLLSSFKLNWGASSTAVLHKALSSCRATPTSTEHRWAPPRVTRLHRAPITAPRSTYHCWAPSISAVLCRRLPSSTKHSCTPLISVELHQALLSSSNYFIALSSSAGYLSRR